MLKVHTVLDIIDLGFWGPPMLKVHTVLDIIDLGYLLIPLLAEYRALAFKKTVRDC